MCHSFYQLVDYLKNIEYNEISVKINVIFLSWFNGSTQPRGYSRVVYSYTPFYTFVAMYSINRNLSVTCLVQDKCYGLLHLHPNLYLTLSLL